MYYSKVLALFSFIFSSFFLNAQCNSLDDLNVTYTYEKNVLEVTLTNNSDHPLSVGHIIIQDEILHFTSNQTNIAVGKEVKISITTLSDSDVTFKIQENCIEGQSDQRTYIFYLN